MLLLLFFKLFSVFLWAAVAFLIWNILIRPLLMEKVFSLILVFLALAFWLFLNGLEFLSLVILLLYIGAISVLFLFVVMIINPDFTDLLQQKQQLVAQLQQRQVVLTALMNHRYSNNTSLSLDEQKKLTTALTSAVTENNSSNIFKHFFFFSFFFLLVFIIDAIVLTLRQTTFAKRQAIGTFFTNILALRLFVVYNVQVAHCDNNKLQLLHNVVQPVQLVCSPLEQFDIPHLSVYLCVIIPFFLIIAHYLSLRYYGVNKLQNALSLFGLQIGFTLYTGYRCYYHIYLDGNVFYFFLIVKLCYVYYRNSVSFFEYTASVVSSKEKGVEERAKIQELLVHFNSGARFAYLQLVVMQLYFLVTVGFNSYHNCTVLISANNMFIQEFVFLVLTICLTLVMHIFTVVWSSDLLKVNKNAYGGLLISLGTVPFIYFISVLCCAMHFDIYHVLVGLLIFFIGLYSYIVLTARLSFEENAGNFLNAYRVFVSFIQGVFVYFSLIIVWLSNYLMPAFLSYLNRFSAYPMDMGELSVELANLEYFQSVSYLDFASKLQVLLFMLGLAFIVGLSLGIRAYLAFFRAYISDAYATEPLILYYYICVFFFLVTRFITA